MRLGRRRMGCRHMTCTRMRTRGIRGAVRGSAVGCAQSAPRLTSFVTSHQLPTSFPYGKFHGKLMGSSLESSRRARLTWVLPAGPPSAVLVERCGGLRAGGSAPGNHGLYSLFERFAWARAASRREPGQVREEAAISGLWWVPEPMQIAFLCAGAGAVVARGLRAGHADACRRRVLSVQRAAVGAGAARRLHGQGTVA